MLRPVRPVALVILTACALYPGLTFTFQGLYAFVAGYHFNQIGQFGPWVDLTMRLGIPPIWAWAVKTAVGLFWLAGVPGLWAGDWRAYPLVLLAAFASMLYPGGPMLMGAIGLICLVFFREKSSDVPA
ncbi:MAG TPA: hypothetical protein VMJ70_07805 [Candidatus Sulfotelmatobacter sp.]|nr:hypothetical protein [Candidatus Sulfotelmatobacter sp.]